MMKNSAALTNLALLATLSFVLSFAMVSIDPSLLTSTLFAMTGVSQLVVIAINKFASAPATLK